MNPNLRSYSSARQSFLSTASENGYALASYTHELTGPDGKAIGTDAAYLGPDQPEQLLILISGPHGVETLCGSLCQDAFLGSGLASKNKSSTGVLLIHALNCWGAAWLRRNNENNVDLCRNFMDFPSVPDFSDRYAAARDLLESAQFNSEDRSQAVRQLEQCLRSYGPEVLVESLMGGQFHDPQGFGYGGSEPQWSNGVLNALLSPFAGSCRQAAIIEYHSGLGPYGYGMAVSMETGSSLDRARNWFGPWVNAPNSMGDEEGHSATGHTREGYEKFLPNSEVNAIVLEFGSFSMQRNLMSLLNDHWLYRSERDWNDELAREIKEELLEVHYPDDPFWRQAVLNRSRQVLEQAISGLNDRPAYG